MKKLPAKPRPVPKPLTDAEQRRLDEQLKKWLREQGHESKLEGK